MNLRIKTKRINEIINPYKTDMPNLPAIVTSNGDTVISSDSLTNYVYMTYGFLSTYYPDSFFECFAKHVNLYQHNIDRIYYVWHKDYDPLDNVDAYEERITGIAKDDVLSNNGTTKSTASNTNDLTVKESTITDTSPVITGKNETTGGGTVTNEQLTDSLISHTNSLSLTDKDGNTINNATETTHDIYRRHGNIGVTKSTELVLSEIDLRSSLPLKQIIDIIIEMCGVFYENEV